MVIKMHVANKSELNMWNEWVLTSPHETIFHTLEWLKIVEKHRNMELIPVIGYRGNEVIGIFPLFLLKKGSFKAAFSPPPKTAMPYLGPLMLEYDQLKQDKREYNLNEFIKCTDNYMFKNLNVKYASVQTPLGLNDSRPFKWSGYNVIPTYTYMVDLSNGKEHIWDCFKKELRKNIKVCEKRGIEIIKSTDFSDVKFIYDSQVNRYENQKLIYPLSLEYLKDIFDVFKDRNLINVFIAKLQDENVGGVIVVTSSKKRKCSMWVGATGIKKIAGVYPNDLIQWKILSWAYENKFKECEIIGANNPTISYFKSRYNPELLITFDCRKVTIIGKFVECFYNKLQQWKIL